MRIKIVIDEKLLADAITASGARTKREAVELKQEALKDYRGKLLWRDDLERLRLD